MIPNLIIGLCVGSVYAMMALSIAVIYRGTHLVNFAHGEFGALGVYIYVQLSLLHHLASAIGLIAGCAVCGACGVAFGLLTRRIGRNGAIVPLIASFGVYLIVSGLTVTIWAPHEPYVLPKFFGSGGLSVSGEVIPYSNLGALGVTVFLGIVLSLLLRFTPIGLQIRALIANRDAAELAGLPTSRLQNITWAIGTMLAGVAAFLYFENTSLVSGSIDIVMISAFAVAAVGGFEHLGAIGIAGALFGLVNQFIDRYANFPAESSVSLGLLIVLLFLMPRALLVARSSRYA
jgi:branched-subunit amino acid ABC-type transport system permease component